MDVNGMLKLGERIRNIERAIMVREGRRRADDTLADRYFAKHQELDAPDSKKAGYIPGPDGHWIKLTRAIDRKKWERLKDYYYAERGWDQETGIPTRTKLEELDLKDIADDLEKQKIIPKGIR